MGSPYTFNTSNDATQTTGTQVADNGQNPWQAQIYNSQARQPGTFEGSNSNGQWPVDTSKIPNGGRATLGSDVGTTTSGIPTQTVPTDQGGQPQQTQVATGGERGQNSTGFTPYRSGQNDLSGNGGSGGSDLMWYLDRTAALGSSVYAAHKGIAGAEKFLPTAYEALQGLKTKGLGETASVLGTSGKEFLQTSAKTDLGKVLGANFVATTLLDSTLFSNKTTSWKTLVVDIGTPLIANSILGPEGKMLKTLAWTVGLHSAEKMLFEQNK
ncbi:MAG: hypothetical protein U0105_18155 [Candidatus Obscuribacterales bacterium]